MKGFTRPSLLDPLRYFCVRWICEEFVEMFVNNVSASLQMFHYQPFPGSELWFTVVDLSNVMALPTVSLLCTDKSLVSVSSFCRALCSAMERVFRFTRSFSHQRSRHSLRISIIVSSCESRYDFFFYRAPFPSRLCNCIRNCSQEWNLFLQSRITSWKTHRACPPDTKGRFTRCSFSLKTRHLCFESVTLPVTHRLNSLPPSMLCFHTRTQVSELISNGISHVASVSPYPSYVELQLLLSHFPHVTEQRCQRSVLPRYKCSHRSAPLTYKESTVAITLLEIGRPVCSTQLFSQKSASIRACISAVLFVARISFSSLHWSAGFHHRDPVTILIRTHCSDPPASTRFSVRNFPCGTISEIIQCERRFIAVP